MYYLKCKVKVVFFFSQMQGPDPSLAYRPNLEKNKEDYRNYEVR